jgi:serine/threonine-protein kinase
MSRGTGLETPSDSADSLIQGLAAAPPRRPPTGGALASPFIEGADVGRYRLVRRLGRGGMGAVWEGVHRISGKHVALKILHDGAAVTPEIRQRFAREAKLVTTVGHPGVVEVHDLFEALDGWPVLVMELLRGETLAEWLRREQPSGRDAAGLLAEVLGIVRAAHRAGVVHRDLKPENIFLCSEANAARPRVRVLDFGIARLLGNAEQAGDESITRTGALIGTPQCMAPEQLYGDKVIDERADVWALGVILYECVSGKKPMTGRNIGQIVRELSSVGIPPVDPEACPKPVHLALRSMLQIDREKRLRDLEKVERLLAAWSKGELRPATRFARSLRSSSRLRHPTRLIAALLVAAGVAAITTRTTPRGASSTAAMLPVPSPGATPKPSPSHELLLVASAGRSSVTGKVLDAWRKSLSLRSGGRLSANLRWPGTTAYRSSERAIVARLRTEQIDGAALGAHALRLVFSGAAALELPGIVDSWAKVDWIRDHLHDPMRAGFEKEGFRLVAWQDEGCERLMSRGRAVRRPADLTRIRIAALDTDPVAPLVYSLVPGAIPVTLGESEVLDALLGGSRLGVTAVVGTAADAERLQWTKALDEVTTMPIACTSGALVLRSRAYNRLGPEERTALDDSAERLEQELAPRARQDDTAASLRLRRALAAVEPSPTDRRDWNRVFARAAQQSARGILPSALVEQATQLSREIDALE